MDSFNFSDQTLFDMSKRLFPVWAVLLTSRQISDSVTNLKTIIIFKSCEIEKENVNPI